LFVLSVADTLNFLPLRLSRSGFYSVIKTIRILTVCGDTMGFNVR